MNCADVTGRLPALAERMLEPGEQAKVQAHLKACAGCASAWKRHQAVDAHLRSFDAGARLPEAFWTAQRRAILDQVVLAPAARTADRFALVRWGVGLAAAAAVALATIGVFRTESPSNAGGPTAKGSPAPNVSPAPEVAKHSPAPSPEVSPEAPRPEIAKSPEPTSSPEPEKPQPEKPDPVAKSPEPTASPEPEKPAPEKPDPIAKGPEPSPSPVPSPSPGPGPEKPKVDPPKKDPTSEALVSAAMPGDPLYALKLALEQSAVVVPRTSDERREPVVNRDSVEQAMSILLSARARLQEVKTLVEAKKTDAALEAVDAYCVLVAEGAVPMMTRLIASKDRVAEAQIEIKKQSDLIEELTTPQTKSILKAAAVVCDKAREGLALRVDPRSRHRAAAYASARDLVALAAAKDVRDRVDVSMRMTDRWQDALMTDAKAEKVAESGGQVDAYIALLDHVCLMLEKTPFTARSFSPSVKLAKSAVDRQIVEFRAFNPASPLRPLIERARDAATEARARLDKIELGGVDPRDPNAKKPDPPPTPTPTPDPAPPSPTPTPDPGFDPK